MSEDSEKNDFLDSIKVDKDYKNPEYEQKKFMEEIKKHPELIDMLSGQRLEYVLNWYKKENERLRKILKKEE